MNLAEIIRATLQQVLDEEGQRLVEEACQMRPVIVGDLSYDAPLYERFVEYGQPPNTVDSTAIVIDENVKALPEPNKEV